LGKIWNLINYGRRNKLITQFKIIYDDDAMFELDKIYLYIKERLKEDKIAQRIVNNIRGKISSLEYFPYAHKLLRKTRNFEYRKFIIKNYIIIY